MAGQQASKRQAIGARTPQSDGYSVERFVEIHGDVHKYVPDWEQWVFFNGRHWEPDKGGLRAIEAAFHTATVMLAEAQAEAGKEYQEDGTESKTDDPEEVAAVVAARAAAKKKRDMAAIVWAKRAQNLVAVKAVVELAAAHREIRLSHEVFDRKPNLFNCHTGTIELTEGTQRKHSKLDYLMKCATGVHYSPTLKSERWEAFLKKVLPHTEARQFLQRYIGYALTGEVGERIFVILYGTGRNGKSLFLETLHHVFGEYASTMPPALLMAKPFASHPTEIASLFGLRLAIGSEVKKGHAFDEETVKRLSGNDRLKARRMREDFWEFSPTHKLILATNHKPRVTDTSDSFWDRVAIVEFGVRIPDEEVNPHLGDLLAQDRHAILSWAVDGLRAYRLGGLAIPEVVKDASRTYRHAEDKISKFLDAACIFQKGAEVRAGELHARLVKWAEKEGVPAPSTVQLADSLRDKGFRSVRKAFGIVWQGLMFQTANSPSSQ